MATAEQVDARVPVREGEYGDRVVTVEPGGVEYISASERHGKPLQMFWTWMSPNLEFATIFVGSLGVFLFGGSFVTVALAIVVGTALGSLSHAVLSSWGPKFGVPQMVQGRAAFGFYGNIIPAGLMSATAGIGWFAVNSVSGTFALSALLGLPLWLSLVIIVLIQIVVAFFGHNLVHAFERLAFIPLVIVFALATVLVFSHANFGQPFNSKAPLAFGGEMGAFLLTAAAAFGYAAGWNPYASDYTRYIPAGANRFRVGMWAGLGVLVSCVVLELMGAALVTVAGTKWGPSDNPTAQLAQGMPDILYKLTLLCIALGAISANVLNIYSGSMSFLTFGINIPSHLRRAMVAIAFGIVGFVVAYSGLNGAAHNYENFLLVISYWIAPWLGVVFTDYWLRRGDYGTEGVFYDRSHANWAGPIALLVAAAVSIYLFSAQSLYTGPVALNVPQLGDLTFLVGFVLAVVIYFVLMKVMGRPRKEALRT
jgi:NCS1 family nucleobase:cation symporter-1